MHLPYERVGGVNPGWMAPLAVVKKHRSSLSVVVWIVASEIRDAELACIALRKMCAREN
jgi:hypothetical protein